MTAGAVEYATSQEAGGQFPEIAPAEFSGAVQLIETNGTISSGAEAVFRSLEYAPGGSWWIRLYERVPGFSAAAEFAYAIVARNRYFASTGTRLLWGDDVRQPAYFRTRGIFLRALGLVFLLAFLSLWAQEDGLMGSGGIAPVGNFLEAAKAQLGTRAIYVFPTLCWLNSSDTVLHLLCATGVAFSLALMAGVLPALGLFLLVVCYLSLTIAGQTFFSFQWDILLLEAGFLAIFFAPWRWRMRSSSDEPVPRVGLFLLKLLLFKLMFMSGVVKLTSGDDSWWNLTALNYHYETQPLPTVLGWWAHQGPAWLKQGSTAFVLLVETLVPFLIWAPRRLRLLACALLLTLQMLIALTGNYAFFNLLTIVLCLLLIDDAVWGRLRKTWRRQTNGATRSVVSRLRRWQTASAVAVLAITMPINAMFLIEACDPEATLPRPLASFHAMLAPLRIVNGYGLFRVMTKRRPEIVIEGSADGVDWVPYEFKWKPGEPGVMPRWVAPHQPRVDWQMWFAALGSYRTSQWIDGLMLGLLRNQAPVVDLLARNPFRQKPPRYVRAILYEYNFTTASERRATGNWWKRRELKEYIPSVSLNE